jgi:hypothetical protein
MVNIEYRIVNFSTLNEKIFEDVECFCKQFEIDFKEQKKNTKRNIFLFFSVKHILNFILDKKIKKPIILHSFLDSDNLFIIKKICKIFQIPEIYHDENDFSEGFMKELTIKSDSYYEKYNFSFRKMQNALDKSLKCSELKEQILKWKAGIKFLNPSYHLP